MQGPFAWFSRAPLAPKASPSARLSQCCGLGQLPHTVWISKNAELAAAQKYLQNSFFFVCGSMFPWHRLWSSREQACFMQSSQPRRHFLCLGVSVFSFLALWKKTFESVLLGTFPEGNQPKQYLGNHALLANINIVAAMVRKGTFLRCSCERILSIVFVLLSPTMCKAVSWSEMSEEKSK